MSTNATTSARSRPPLYGWHFAATTLLTLVMLAAMTVHFGFQALAHTARDISGAVLKHVEAQQGLGMAPADIVEQSLKEFHDAAQIEVCIDGRCDTRAASADTPFNAELRAGLGWPCATQAVAHRGSTRTATVCMVIDDVMEDIGRDAMVLLIAQAIGFGIWFAATRRFVARREIWTERVARAATTDAATGLLNRASFRVALDEAAARGDEGWLVLAGIDELKSVNELHGSSVGDHVILTVAERLKDLGAVVRVLGRTGGDEFAFVLDGASPTTLERSLSRLRAAMAAPIEHQGLLLSASISAGAVAVERQLSAAELMRRANVALRAAKKVGPDSQSIFNVAYDVELRKHHQLRLDLMNAVEKGHLELVYQPIVDARGQVVVAEALARWKHRELGFVSPEVFIAAAESSGLIHELGIALLKKACEDLAAARRRGLPLKRLAVNLSPAQLTNPDLASIVYAVVRGAGLEPADIELELTESAAMASRQDATQQLRELAEVGFAISIDDFGTGYSSLSRLQTLPLSKLKIDRSFVRAFEEPSGAVLLDAMMDLSRRLGLSCVCEGVETAAQMHWLRDHGCDLFQGYLIGKPMPLDQLIGLGFRVPLPGATVAPDPARRSA
ncbi:putative bifunctional diguanylate cyclase/phosphodiesterase [Roseateles chitosanitabidus]|uniref:putative bifunctional diguanylate cyclase/phosphodiesterase n=1 Tax=Roseateles chitosanitabidus TaxID=65048 RepID=UPI00082FBA63|nr:bifunctional diguanylate cyclase/phosphodiesterase [Roseateles chitosanitabidus]